MTDTARVSEDKFNGTATLEVSALDKETAKAAAKKYFEDTHGSRPSKVVAEEKTFSSMFDDGIIFEVVVSDHSSGSLAVSEEYEF